MSQLKSINIPPTNHVRVLDGGQGWIGLLNHMGDQNTITNAARVSFSKMRDQFSEKDQALLKYLIQNKHLTPFEHVVFQFSVHCPLYVRGQWHRHRAFSYNEISRRYTEFDMQFYIPDNFRKQSDNNKQASIQGSLIEENKVAFDKYSKIVDNCFDTYEQLLKLGVCKQQARGVLPQTMMTTFWCTADLRNLINFLQLRDDQHAQVQIREYAKAIKKLISPYIPHVAKYFNWKF